MITLLTLIKLNKPKGVKHKVYNTNLTETNTLFLWQVLQQAHGHDSDYWNTLEELHEFQSVFEVSGNSVHRKFYLTRSIKYQN